MNWIIKIVVPEKRTRDGVLVEHQETEHTIPFTCGEKVYYVHRKKWWKDNSPYVVMKSTVTGVWATNTVVIILGGDNHIAECEFGSIFLNKEEAIEYCIKKNDHRKVKIYGEQTNERYE